MSLYPEHLADLRKSGLNDRTILDAGIYSVPPADFMRKLGFNDPKIESLMAFPYPGCNGFERFKVFPPQDGKKYLQPKGSGSHLYIPTAVRKILNDPTIPLYIVEGEKKTSKGVQEGLHCIGLGGLWNWSDGSEDKNLIPDFDLINWEGREVYLVPDNDWLQSNRHGEHRNLRQAVFELGYRLIDRGAKALIIKLPPGPLKGLDDYFCGHTVEEFRGLPKLEVRKKTILEMIETASLDNFKEILRRLGRVSATERAIYIKELANKLKIPKSAIKNDIKKKIKKEENRENSTLFEEIEPWDEPVEGNEIANEIEAIIKTCVIMSEYQIFATTLWILLTYCYRSFFVVPLLVILSPEKRCGKTTLLQVLSRLVYRPLFSCNISPSALYRTIQKYSPCLLIDEADSFLSNNEELRGILNAGHTKEDSFVIRTNKDSLEPEIFMTFGPKAIASIGKVPDTLIDRSIKIYLKRKRLEEKVKRLGSANSFTDLKRKIFKWIIDCKDRLENTTPEVPEEVSSDRGIDNWFPLLAIADAIGGEWPKKIREAMFDLEVGTFQELTLNQILFEDIREIFTDRERISSKDLVEELLKMEDRPWPEYKRGRPLTINQLARLLKPYGISPKTIRMSPEKTAKGFLKMDFEDMFRRYLPPLINEREKKSVYTPFQSVTTSQSNDFEDLAQFRNVTSSVNVTDQKLSNLLKLKECYGVTDPKGGKSVNFPAEGKETEEIDFTGMEIEW
jgi:hypothetical protein